MEKSKNTPEKIIADYFKLENKIHKIFGYHERWKKFPILNWTERFWKIKGEDQFLISDKELTSKVLDAEDYELVELYKYRGFDKWIYTADNFTMALVNSSLDDNKYLIILSNSKNSPDPN